MSKYSDPGAAAMLSLIPGLGHIYEGQKRKGILFLSVSAINVLLFLVIALNDQMIANFLQIGAANHIQPNDQLIKALKQVSFGSTVSVMFAGLVLSFLAYAIQDAYDQASFVKRQRIYPEQFWEMPEATSSSYIIHFALMASCFILAMFFLVPPKPKQQVTDIMFIQNIPKQDRVKQKTNIRSINTSKPSGKHNPQKEIAHQANQTNQLSPAQTMPPNLSEMPKAVPHMPLSQTRLTNIPTPVVPQTQAQTPSRTSITTPAKSFVLPPMQPTAQEAFRSPAMQDVRMPTPRAQLSAGLPIPTARTQGITAGSPLQPTAVNLSPGSKGTSATFAKSNAGNNTSHLLKSTGPIASGNLPANGRYGLPTPKAQSTFGTAGTQTPAPIKSSVGPGGGTSFVPISPSLPRPGNSVGVGQEANSDANHAGDRPSPGVTHDANFGPYMDDLQRRIKRNWFPPKDWETKRVVVNFKIHTDGSLSHLRIEKSSGSNIADQAALKAVENAQPFRQLPQYAPNNVDIQFTFDYNVFGGHRR